MISKRSFLKSLEIEIESETDRIRDFKQINSIVCSSLRKMSLKSHREAKQRLKRSKKFVSPAATKDQHFFEKMELKRP